LQASFVIRIFAYPQLYIELLPFSWPLAKLDQHISSIPRHPTN